MLLELSETNLHGIKSFMLNYNYMTTYPMEICYIDAMKTQSKILYSTLVNCKLQKKFTNVPTFYSSLYAYFVCTFFTSSLSFFFERNSPM